MIKVLWLNPDFGAWTGGHNYFRNLLLALLSLPQRKVEPVLLNPSSQLDYPFSTCKAIPSYANSSVPFWHYRTILKWMSIGFRKTHSDYDQYLKMHGIQLFSHFVIPTEKTSIPVLAWIPDFQQRHLPQFFTKEEIIKRNNEHERLARTCQGILLSSDDALRDFNYFHPGYEHKSYVLKFVSIPISESELPSPDVVLEKYKIYEPYFHVPNQLWAHKNHGIVVDALIKLAEKGCKPLIISTGQKEDHRNPEYFVTLMQEIEKKGYKEQIRFLGKVGLNELSVLMRNSVAMINPSYFEGWSTTVEEAKSIGKRIILSDLAVHREQAPERSVYFNPRDAAQLASIMDDTLQKYDVEDERIANQKALKELPERIMQFALTYENIVLDMIG